MNSKKQILVVYNPGRWRAKRKADSEQAGRAIRAWAQQLRLDIAWQTTHYPGHATELCRNGLSAGVEIIISVGGDGTHNEVVNGFFDENGQVINQRATLGIFDCGTGGDFRKSLGIGKTVDDAIAVLQRGRAQAIDVGRIEYCDFDGKSARRYFCNVASAGMSGLVDTYVGRSRWKWAGGRAAFAEATFRAFFNYRNQTISISIDDAAPRDCVVNTLAIGNGRYFGGGMNVAPYAILNDGLLDVVCLGDFHARDYLIKGIRLYRGTHLSLKEVWHAQARTIQARSGDNKNVLLDIDGEAAGTLPVTFSIITGAVNVFAGEKACLR
jgi:YegS/Rv2252/BmrU family lipid kinase